MSADSRAPANKPLSDLDIHALRVIAENSRELATGSAGINPSGLAYALVECGAIKLQHGRRRLRAQGAGFVGGRLIARLQRAGLVMSAWPQGAWVTIAGRKELASRDTQEVPGAGA